ncbi:uncharacterized protein LOC143285883 [Babylonia areolata]|uniref:uncharacterized protein LOC143285883 n=1 Tax=Babylonia areolata TaxID=304850 RepID=UPI003FD636D3
MKLTLTCLQRRLSGRTTLPLLFLLVVAVVLLQLQPLLSSLITLPAFDTPHMGLGAPPHARAGLVTKRTDVGEGGGREEGEKGGGGGGGGWYNAPNCSVLDFLGRPDPTVQESYDPALVCGPPALRKDVICATFFSQIDLKDDGDCLRQHDDTEVPRIVYYVIFGMFEFKFLHYVSFVAAKRFIRPSGIYLIGDIHPYGPWWQRLMKDVKGVRFVHRRGIPTIANKPVRFKHHVSDAVRLQVLLLNGGIYLDADMVMVRDPEPILHHDLTLGLIENATGMGNAFIMAKRNNDFVREWYEQYNRYNNVQFFNNSLWVPRDMWHRNPGRLHMESDRLYRPNWFEADKLFKGWDYDWRQNYAVHVWTNGNIVPASEADILTSNTTIAKVFRNALYGDPSPR